MNESKWFTANLSHAQAMKHQALGLGYLFGERVPRELFEDYGMNIRVLQPRQPASLYHSESVDESFLVLGGRCRALVDDEWVELARWDFLHCPPDTPHLIVGAGDGPSWVLMVGGRVRDNRLRFPVNEKAAEHGASVERETTDGADAWSQVGWSFEDFEPAELPWPPID
jgi:uncharacterized cupin superfamily protein